MINLIIITLSLLLVSCSHTPAAKKNPIDESQQYLEDAQKARKEGPLEGDVRVLDGAEYVYGKNVKYMNTPGEPPYVWLRRDLYTPSVIDTLPSRVGDPTKETKEVSQLKERLAKLERAIGGGPAPETSRPKQPVKDAEGRTWTLYFRNDDGVEWFIDEGVVKPSSTAIRLWRKRVFPRWAFQKELVTLDEINCREARYRTRELRVTSWDGATQTSDEVTPWSNIFSNSPEEYLMNEYCK
jgi:hypothetical protein